MKKKQGMKLWDCGRRVGGNPLFCLYLEEKAEEDHADELHFKFLYCFSYCIFIVLHCY